MNIVGNRNRLLPLSSSYKYDDAWCSVGEYVRMRHSQAQVVVTANEDRPPI